jgi:predicted ATPase
MFRQVAYDTLSRRERKARHLAVAAHLRNAFPDNGEEVAEVVARHLIDALKAVPDDADGVDLRDEAVAMLTRAGERAARTGARLRRRRRTGPQPTYSTLRTARQPHC